MKSENCVTETTNTPGKNKYSDEEERLLLEEFESRVRANISIPGKDISEFIRSHAVLKNNQRTVSRVRSFFQHYTNKNPCQKSKKPKRKTEEHKNTIPNSIYRVFSNYIDAKKVPQPSEIISIMSSSPTFEKYSPIQTCNLIAKTIEYE